MIDPANASELAEIAREIGADVLEGALRCPSDTGGWQLGDLGLSEYLDRHRTRQLVLEVSDRMDSKWVLKKYHLVGSEGGRHEAT